MKRVLATLIVGVAAMAIAAPAQAMTPGAVTPGWSPSDPPLDRSSFDAQMSSAVYAVSCGGVVATGWASHMLDDTRYDWRTYLVTTSEVAAACSYTRSDMAARQGSETFPAYAWIWGTPTDLGSATLLPDRPGVYWDQTPSPRIGQWVGIGGRSPDGTMLPILERRIVAIGSTSFTLNEAVGADYLGAPVADNKMRVLGSLIRAGTEVTGSPTYCAGLFDCAEPDKVWWDITAPSGVRNAKAVGGKRSVRVSWKAAASDAGADVVYWYLVGTGDWVLTDTFAVTVKARSGSLVSVTIGTVNAAGPGPMVTVSAKAK